MPHLMAPPTLVAACPASPSPSSGRPGTTKFGAVLIPAHNEAAVIGRCLDALIDGLEQDEVELVVSCNGCTDDTAAVARRHAPSATILEIGVASKAAALRAAEEVVSSFPRLYVDADVVVTGRAAMSVLRALTDGAVAARPPFVYDSTRSSAPVRAYYRARLRIPSLTEHAWGAGVYGLSAAARARFATFPDVVADDLLVDRVLRPGELEVVDTDPVLVTPPRDVSSLLRVLRRAQRGKAEAPPSGGSSGAADGLSSQVARLATQGPRAAIDVAAFSFLSLAARVSERITMAETWGRDDSSRRG